MRLPPPAGNAKPLCPALPSAKDEPQKNPQYPRRMRTRGPATTRQTAACLRCAGLICAPARPPYANWGASAAPFGFAASFPRPPVFSLSFPRAGRSRLRLIFSCECVREYNILSKNTRRYAEKNTFSLFYPVCARMLRKRKPTKPHKRGFTKFPKC